MIVEKRYGRLCNLWKVLSYKYKWAETGNDKFLEFASHPLVCLHPLSEEDGIYYSKAVNRLASISLGATEKRRGARERYPERRTQNIALYGALGLLLSMI